MEIVVGSLALEYNLITEPVFVAIIFGAVISSVILGPWLSYSIRRRREISILEYFSPRGIIGALRYNERDKVIEELCELAATQVEEPDSDDIYKAVIIRENEMGTALEEGIAVPHARLPDIKSPLVIFGRSIDGVEWNSPDGKPVHFIFLILTPEEGYDTQVQILSFIAKAMSEAETRSLIADAEEEHGIWDVLRRAFAGKNIVKNKKKN